MFRTARSIPSAYSGGQRSNSSIHTTTRPGQRVHVLPHETGHLFHGVRGRRIAATELAEQQCRCGRRFGQLRESSSATPTVQPFGLFPRRQLERAPYGDCEIDQRRTCHTLSQRIDRYHLSDTRLVAHDRRAHPGERRLPRTPAPFNRPHNRRRRRPDPFAELLNLLLPTERVVAVRVIGIGHELTSAGLHPCRLLRRRRILRRVPVFPALGQDTVYCENQGRAQDAAQDESDDPHDHRLQLARAEPWARRPEPRQCGRREDDGHRPKDRHPEGCPPEGPSGSRRETALTALTESVGAQHNNHDGGGGEQSEAGSDRLDVPDPSRPTERSSNKQTPYRSHTQQLPASGGE